MEQLEESTRAARVQLERRTVGALICLTAAI
jgi:hypothetical protein